MTLVEFIAPVKTASNRAKVLGCMYFLARYKGQEEVRADDIKTALKSARVARAATMNVPDVLNKSGHFVDSPGSDGIRRLWRLTPSGEREVRSLLELPEREPEIEHDVSALSGIAREVANPEAKRFIDESILCLRIGALRAAVVFLWSGAMRTLHETAWQKGSNAITSAIRKHDAKAREVKKLDDFAYVKDSIALVVFQDLGLIDKGQKTILEQALELRNQCGHPTKYNAGEKRVSSFIEDVVGIVF